MVHQCACLGFSGVIFVRAPSAVEGSSGVEWSGGGQVRWRGKKEENEKQENIYKKINQRRVRNQTPVRFQECKPNLFVLMGLNRTLRFPGKGEAVQPFLKIGLKPEKTGKKKEKKTWITIYKNPKEGWNQTPCGLKKRVQTKPLLVQRRVGGGSNQPLWLKGWGGFDQTPTFWKIGLQKRMKEK